MEKAKQISWKRFVAKEGHKQPWSIIYKLQTERLKLESVQSNITGNDTQTKTWNETTDILMNTLIPSDEEVNDTDWHRNLRTDTREIERTADGTLFTMQEIATIVKSLNTNKSPRHDLIEVKIVKEA